MRMKRHLAINIDGLLKCYKGRKIDCLSDNGRQLSDIEARRYLGECKAKGWKYIPSCKEEDCPDFDHFDRGCPGHILKDE